MEPISIRSILSSAQESILKYPKLAGFGVLLALFSLFEREIASLFIPETPESEFLDTLLLSFKEGDFTLVIISLFILFLLSLATRILFIRSFAEYTKLPGKRPFFWRTLGRSVLLEIAYWGTLILLAILFLLPGLLSQATPETSNILHSLGIGFFIFCALFSFIWKQLTFLYLTLSDIRFKPAINLGALLLERYSRFSTLFLLSFFFFALIFTFLENLAILESAFLSAHLTNSLPVSVFGFSLLLGINTIFFTFTELLWIYFFLALANKKSPEVISEIKISEEAPNPSNIPGV